jgi:hypothetical protein
MIVGGLGMAITMTPMTAAALGAVAVDKAGVGSGVLNSMRQVGGSLGVAIMGAILGSYISVPQFSPEYAGQFVDGFQSALHVAAAIAFVAALIAVVTVRRVRHEHEPALELG